MTQLLSQIKSLARVLHSETIAVRRHLHINPELSCEEKETSEFIQKMLDKANIKFMANVGGYGIVAHIQGNNPTKGCVALRADMDALPIQEENDISYKSGKSGVMHACGHDAHTASLLTAGKILNQLKNDLTGTVKLIFQPSEERFPGGALSMINDGVLENPKPNIIFGTHVSPELDTGIAGIKSGPFMASADEVYISVKGKGGHAGTPHLNVDTVVIAANIIVALQQISGRFAPPSIPTVLSFGKVDAAGQTNVIPDIVEIAGTFRTFDEKWRSKAHRLIESIASNSAKGMGGEALVKIKKGYPFLINDHNVACIAKSLAIEYLGEENVVEPEQRMTAEDFAYYSHKIPACFIRTGIRNKDKGIVNNLHTSRFNIDEKSLETTSGLMAWLAAGSLKNL